VTGLSETLSGIITLGLDTAPIIYFIEANPSLDQLITGIFERIAKGECAGVTSVITLTEVLTMPLRSGNRTLQNQYIELLRSSENFITLPVSFSIAEKAAELRARYNLRTPDAIQIATAMEAGCQAFLTNDLRLKRVEEIEIILLSELKT
jgi:predicted nucleic acid-binding protein